MNQYASASVYGITGSVRYGTVNGAGAVTWEGPLDLVFLTVEASDESTNDDFMNGEGEEIGKVVKNKKHRLTVGVAATVAADAGRPNKAKAALKCPPNPSLVELTLPDTATAAGVVASLLWGVGTVSEPTPVAEGSPVIFNYWGGAQRTLLDGRAGLRIPVERSLTSPLTPTQLATPAT